MGGNSKGSRRRFGAPRRLPSGRWQIRYPDPTTGQLRSGEKTYETKTDAEIALSLIEADITRGKWTDPDAGRVNFGSFADSWLKERKLEARTYERYEGVIRLYIKPGFGHLDLAAISPAAVRSWRQGLIDRGVGAATVAKSYQVLRTILHTAVDDELITRNPCRIKGAADAPAPERPVLTVDEVFAVVDAIAERWRALVLLATFTSLRFGELAYLRRQDIDMDACIIRVRRAQAELQNGALVEKDPKSEAGKRPVGFPVEIAPVLRKHLDSFAGDGPAGHVFLGPKGGQLRRSNFHEVWTKAVSDAGVSPVRFHDLRHTGNELAADAGANTRDLMKRMGHSTMRAALVYQHRSVTREQKIARQLGEAIRWATERPAAGASGTDLAREP